jgi:hypothetical protein
MVGMMRIRLFRFAPLLLVALAAGSCGPARNQFAPACPIPSVARAPLAEFTRYRGASHDVRDLIISAKVVDVRGKCEPGDDNATIVAKARAYVEVTRGPAMDGLTYQLPLWIAVTDAEAVRDKTLFALTVEFSRNADHAVAVSPEVEMQLAVTPAKSAAAYGILAGFQITPEEVAAWRRDHHR